MTEADPLDVAQLGGRAIRQLVVRAVILRAITLVGTIALARLLAPAEFGAFAVITIIVTFIATLGDLGTNAAIIQQDHEPTRVELSTAFATQLFVWTGFGILTWVAAGLLPVVLPTLTDDAVGVARLLAVALFLGGLRAVPTAMLTRVLRFGPLALVEVGQQVVYFGVAVALASRGYGIWSFGVATVLQGLFATVVINLAWGAWYGLRFDLAIARRLWGFGLAFQVANALTWGRDAIVPILGGLAGGLDAIGFLGFAWRNGQLVTAVEQIVQRVAFPAFSRLQGNPGRRDRMARTSIELVVLAVTVIQGWIVATAPILVPIVFSDRWTAAVVPLQIVCLGSLASGPTYVLRSLVYAQGESARALWLSAIGLIVMVVAFPILAINAGLEGAAVAFALSAYATLAMFIWATRATLHFPWIAVLWIIVVVVVSSIVGGAIATAVPTPVGLFVSGVLYLATVAAACFTLDRQLATRVLRLISLRRAA